MELPRIPEASSLVVSSGNVINWQCLKTAKRISQSTSEEIKDSLTSILGSTLNMVDWKEEATKKSLSYAHSRCRTSLTESSSRDELKVTVKAMMCNTEPEVMIDAVEKVLEELETTTIDVLLLAVSKKPNVIETFTMDHLMTLWSVLERMVEKGQIQSLGVCDLDKAGLEELYNWAKIKPRINQVNEISCCIIPPDLNAFAKEKKIQLLTHGDASEILPAEDFQDIVKNAFSESDAEGWHPSWVLRYTAMIRCRGVITTKGYIVRAQRNLHNI